MKRVDWAGMLTHEEYEDDRAFAYFHRDMGGEFHHVGMAMCPCGPIRIALDDAPKALMHTSNLDNMSHRMVN